MNKGNLNSSPKKRCTSSSSLYYFMTILCNQPHSRQRQAYTSFYCTLLYCASEILHFSQSEGLWQPCIKQVYRRHFPNSIIFYLRYAHCLYLHSDFYFAFLFGVINPFEAFQPKREVLVQPWINMLMSATSPAGTASAGTF